MTYHQSKSQWAALAIAAWCLVAIGYLSSKCLLSRKDLERHHSKDEHTIPTILSVVDEETGKYVYALDNPLYEKLQRGVFLPDGVMKVPNYYMRQDNILETPKIQFDQTSINLRDPLQVSWTLGRTKAGHSVVDDNDILVLYCDEQIWERDDSNRRNFLDAATIAQARATSNRQENGDNDILGDNVWYFSSFPVVRRKECEFALYKTLPRNTYALLASSKLLDIANAKAAPTAIHLALGNKVGEMVVQFKTGMEGTPVVQYGADKNSLQLHAIGTSHTYSAKDMCQEPASEEGPGKFQSPGHLHVVRLAQLEPNTTYHYKVGVVEGNNNGAATTTWSKTFSFVSAPEVTANPGPFSYIVYGDQGCPSDGWGQGGVWTAAMTSREAKSSSLPIRSVHHFGDLSYARGAAHIWDEWLNMIESFTTRVPLMVSVGNHEYDHTKGGENGKDPSGVPTPNGYRPKWGNMGKDSGGECGVPTASLFTMPNSTKSNGVFWYSYDYGNVHTTVISAEHDLSPGSDQYEWLEEDLKSVNRTKLPWLVLELHRPLYELEVSPMDILIGAEMRHRMEDLLKQYQVDLVLTGHIHSYQRSCSGLYKGKCHNGGPTHLLIGSAGASLRHEPLAPGTKHLTKKLIRGSYGYGRITVANASALHFEFVKAGAKDDAEAGRVLDDTWLLKDPLAAENSVMK